MKILIVDDNKSIREVLTAWVSARGFEATTTTLAKEGIQLFFQGHFDLAILDVEMPEFNGFKSQEELGNLRAVGRRLFL